MPKIRVLLQIWVLIIISALHVSPGDNVYTGQIIGAIGSTGVSNGPHLHLEYIVYQDGWQYADPMTLWGT